MASSEAMTSSTHSFAYSYGLVKKCFLKICETSKFHNFLIFQPIFIRFSLFCSIFFTLSSKIKLDQLRTSPLNILRLHKIIIYIPCWDNISISNSCSNKWSICNWYDFWNCFLNSYSHNSTKSTIYTMQKITKFICILWHTQSCVVAYQYQTNYNPWPHP